MIKVDFTNVMVDAIGEMGLKPDDFHIINTSSVMQRISQRVYSELAFLDLAKQDLSEIKKLGMYARDFDNLLILGIGGSALGPRAIMEALRPFHNVVSKPKVYIYDNVDPLTLSCLLEILDIKETLVNVITKSGSTAETMASFMVLWQRIKDAGLDVKKHIIATTDPQKGDLRKIVNDYGLFSLEVPPKVGGRFSVLSAVGLLLAEVLGISSEDMLKGVSDIEARCLDDNIDTNPALMFSAVSYLLHTLKGVNTTVLFPYSDQLRRLSEWFCQLWAESLGKEGRGLTPYPSVGTTDQHSQLQLWMEGPKDKLVVFIAIDDYGRDVDIPLIECSFNDFANQSYLSNHRMSELIKVEQEASEIALTKNGRCNITIKMPKIDAYHFGQLFSFFEICTAITGMMLNINPFDQPGVEEGKNLTYGMMGKKGYDKKRQEFIEYRKRPRIVI
ncbi:MAG: glucose-6-phosphate isomerase [Thermodesulfovibrionales bacterium]